MVAAHRDRHAVAGHHLIAVVKDRKSTRLNSSHSSISYAVFCLKKKIPRGVTSLVAADTIVRSTHRAQTQTLYLAHPPRHAQPREQHPLAGLSRRHAWVEEPGV